MDRSRYLSERVEVHGSGDEIWRRANVVDSGGLVIGLSISTFGRGDDSRMHSAQS
jgi:hypothetical protein